MQVLGEDLIMKLKSENKQLRFDVVNINGGFACYVSGTLTSAELGIAAGDYIFYEHFTK